MILKSVCSCKIEKEKKQIAKEIGGVRNEVSGAEVIDRYIISCVNMFLGADW